MEREEQLGRWDLQKEEPFFTLGQSKSRFEQNGEDPFVVSIGGIGIYAENNANNHHNVIPVAAAAVDDDKIKVVVDQEGKEEKLAGVTQVEVDEIHHHRSGKVEAADDPTKSNAFASSSVYYDPNEGSKSNSTHCREQHARRKPGDTKDSNSASLQHSEILPKYDGTIISSSKSVGNNDESEDFDLINGSDAGIEVDLENLLGKQNTHDLYCPNCNSCITRRVILKKRKRKVRVTSEDGKRNKQEATVVGSSSGDLNSREIQSDVPTVEELVGNDYEHDERKPEIFRCLSCFSLFIPTGKGFTIFGMFPNKGENKALQKQPRSVSKNWISSIFRSHEKPISGDIDIRSGNALTTSTVSPLPSSSKLDAQAQSLGKQKDDLSHICELPGPGKSGIVYKSQNDVENSRDLTKEELVNGKETSRVGDKSESALGINTVASTNEHFEAVAGSHGSPSNIFISSDAIPVDGGELQENVMSVSTQDGRKLLISSRGNDSPTRKKVAMVQNSDLTMQTSSKGKDTVIVIEPNATVCEVATQQSRNMHISEDTGDSARSDMVTSVTEQRRANVRESYGIDIIKSLVYGGLIESIVSLGIVSSAAGGGTATLNILTLSLANLCGGVVLIFHNLKELKKEPMSDDHPIDRYQELLGRRENYLLHATVAILSFLIFGLIPPTAYTLSFQKTSYSSNARDLKMLASASSALGCILALATGKAYVQMPPKAYVKTIAEFILMGFMVSGICYLVGEQLDRLLHFQTTSDGLLGLPHTMTTSTGFNWATSSAKRE
ncbi:OLC1v1020992C1 [Oldenlandia corymbosa var. corymbosa]|uniref:OLC1v1020992C1 n=1 Tax=Oldenlandia corymbosa var. corymbosa TaxID=529605 RepID=A0AAV1BUN9_OLDCO|nr:OLC1v1020992C1 [Oldenlandia corymbosa var. corymbosa]